MVGWLDGVVVVFFFKGNNIYTGKTVNAYWKNETKASDRDKVDLAQGALLWGTLCDVHPYKSVDRDDVFRRGRKIVRVC